MFTYRKSVLALVVLISSSFIHANDDQMKALALMVHKSTSLPTTYLHHNNNGFQLITPQGIKEINRWDMDKELRGISQLELKQRMNAGNYLQLKKLSNDDYALHLQGRLNGGGPIGAWIGATVGGMAVNAVGYGAIYLASSAVGVGVTMVAGPIAGGAAGMAADAALKGALIAPIQSTALAVGLAGGIALGSATGPL